MSASKDGMKWLRETFTAEIDAAVAHTPFSRNLIFAISMQETSYIWLRVYKMKSVEEVLALCVGDTIDAPGRSVFPKTRAELEGEPNGHKMFALARSALEAVAAVDKTYEKVAKNKDKFCHGFGMFQYDIQSFRTDPDYFLNSEWKTFTGTLGKCISELKSKLEIVYGSHKSTLTHNESVYVAIAYNTGHVNLHKDFKQGYKDGAGKFYGEAIDEFLRMAETLE